MDVFKKAGKIIDLYENRCNTQKVIAEKFGIPVKKVARVTKMYGYEHTKRVTSQNANKGQCVKPIVYKRNLQFLDDIDI